MVHARIYRCLFVLLFALFLTSASKAQSNEPFSFAFISDTHINENSETPSEDLKRTVRDINRNSDIEFVVLTGDITEFGSDAELMEADSILQQLNKPWYIIPGNHDTNWSESGTNSFKQILRQERVAFTSHGILFIGCGSGPNMRMSPGLVPHEDVVWLRAVLDDVSEDKPVIFLNHYPINKSLANWYLIIEELKKANTQAILNGHHHRNKASNYEGIPGVMGRSNLRADKKVGGYNIVTVCPDMIKFAERNPGVKTHEPWRKIPRENHNYAQDSTSYSHPSYAVNDKYSKVEVEWKKQSNSDIGAGIIAHQGLAIYPNTAGNLVARNVKNGELVWKFKTGSKIYSTPAAKGNHIVFASTDSTIYNVNSHDGSLRWKVKTGKSIVASPTIDDDTIYIGSSEGKFRAFSLNDGTIKWTNNDIKGFIVTRPLVDEKRVYFGSWGTYFYALNKETGQTSWEWTNGSKNRMYSPAAVYPVKANGKIFIVAPDRYITSLDANTGEVVWRSNKHKGRESIGITPDKSRIYIKAMNDSLFTFSTRTDSINLAWSLDADFGYEIGPSPITATENVIYIPTDDGRIFAVNRRKKEVQWIHKISNALVNYVYPLGDNEVLATTMDGKIVRLSYNHH